MSDNNDISPTNKELPSPTWKDTDPIPGLNERTPRESGAAGAAALDYTEDDDGAPPKSYRDQGLEPQEEREDIQWRDSWGTREGRSPSGPRDTAAPLQENTEEANAQEGEEGEAEESDILAPLSTIEEEDEEEQDLPNQSQAPSPTQDERGDLTRELEYEFEQTNYLEVSSVLETPQTPEQRRIANAPRSAIRYRGSPVEESFSIELLASPVVYEEGYNPDKEIPEPDSFCDDSSNLELDLRSGLGRGEYEEEVVQAGGLGGEGGSGSAGKFVFCVVRAVE
ncbi:MAG: hypothetical protein M1829_004704 [Trizodia sp. TS-e1964]|nr:MAG: hypothetical protein M1829_004704 [Trizodia sp. TS-e1964]